MKKKTFWGKDESTKFHLRFIISDPDPDNVVMAVHMTTYRNNGREDNSCILNPGDHEAVKENSFIRYDKAIELNFKQILKMKFNNELIFKDDISDKILHRIQNGAKISDALPLKFNKFFQYF